MKYLAFASLVALSVVSSASTIRHDRNDIDYRNLGNSFVAVGEVFTNSGYGSGTYIGFGNGSHWALTAAHVTNTLADNPQFRVNGNVLGVSQVIAFSGWNLNFNDFSLLRLTSNPGIAPMAYYNGNGEVGLQAVSVGFGATGTGLTGINAGAGTKRGFENMVDVAIVNGSTNALFTDFDNPLNAGDSWSGSPTPLNLEGCVAGGDSGGALLLNVNSVWAIAGVTSTLNWVDGTGNADYGDISGYSRIGGNNVGANWIAQNTGIQGVPEPGTMIALGLGLSALAARRRRKA
jgi:hypothetical protein